MSDLKRPTCRAECVDGPRPCPWVSCRHNMLLDRAEVGYGGAVLRGSRLARLAQATDKEAAVMIEEWAEEVGNLSPSCALDLADDRGTSVEDIALALGITDKWAEELISQAVQSLSIAAARPRRRRAA